MATLKTTAIGLTGGTDADAGKGMDTLLTVGGTWATGDKLTVIMTDKNGLQTQVGAGNVSGLELTYCFTFGNKVYGLSGASAYFSALAAPTVFNDPTAAGNSYIELANYYATPEDLVAMAPFQGKAAFIARNTVQVWAMDPDPDLNAQQQVLVNIGTVAKLSVQPIGDTDVRMLAESGFRSLSVRVATSNAQVEDFGSPIDLIIQPKLAAMSDASKSAACSVVEPLTNRYWCYLPGDKIYVFSDFKDSGIKAWCTYEPTAATAINAPAANYPDVSNPTLSYSGLTSGRYLWVPGPNEALIEYIHGTVINAGFFTLNNPELLQAVGKTAGAAFTGKLYKITEFVPEKFVTYQSRIYCRAGDKVYLYGGSDNATYDACGLQARIPFLDCEAPATQKNFHGLDAAIEGEWQICLGTDYTTEDFSKVVYRSTESSFQAPHIPMNRRATHFSLDFLEVSDDYGRLSSALVHFEMNQAKK